MSKNNLIELMLKADEDTIRLLWILAEQLEILDNQPLVSDIPDSTS